MTCPSLWLGWRPSWRLSWRLLAAMAVCAVLSACADLKGLRDYAKSSQQLAAGPELVSRWQQSEQVLQSRQVLFDAPVAARRTPQAQALADAQGKKVQEIQRTLAAYFKAVGDLAADELPSLGDETARLGDAWEELDPSFQAADRQALRSLGQLLSQPLQAYRHRAVLALVKSQHAAVARLLTRLEALSLLMALDLQAEAEAARLPYLQLLGQTPQPALRFLLRERMAAMQASHYEPLQEAWSRHQAALRAVRQAHERLSEVDELSQLRGHAKVMSEAIQSVQEWQSARAAVRAR